MKGVRPLPNLIQALYKITLKPVLFQMGAETAHIWSTNRLKNISNMKPVLNWIGHNMIVKDDSLKSTLYDLTFPNPVGLAAGFDKEAELYNVLSYFGFGFIEVGTFTPLPQDGHDKPRLFRFKSQKALINRMGFNNPGAGKIADRMRKRTTPLPIGINIGKGKNTPNDQAESDYIKALDAAFPWADYIVFNVSSPNTPGLRDLQAMESIKHLLSVLSTHHHQLATKSKKLSKPLFLKLSPDLDKESIQEIVKICVERHVGIIATNTSIDHSLLGPHKEQQGGLSGKPIKALANQTLKIVYATSKGAIPIIGVGGIASADDAYEKIQLGANLVQIYTGWIYEGPGLVSQINKGLLKLMKRDGFAKIQDAVGTL